MGALRIALEPGQLRELAALVAAELAEQVEQGGEDRWLDAKGAADYLSLSVNGLHRLTAARRIPFSQQEANGRLYFRRADLDDWRSSQRRGPNRRF